MLAYVTMSRAASVTSKEAEASLTMRNLRHLALLLEMDALKDIPLGARTIH